MDNVAILAISTVLLGAMNNVTSKMRSVTLGPFNYMSVLMNSTLYFLVYAGTLIFRKKRGIIDQSEIDMFWKRSSMPSFEERLLPLDTKGAPAEERRGRYSIMSSPWAMVIVAGCMDASGNLMGFISQAHLPQVLYQLFLQDLVLFSVILSMILLGRRYSVYHVVGLLLTVISGLIGVLPDLQFSCDFRWGLLAALSTLPTAISYIAKERLFAIYAEKNKNSDRGLDVFVLNTHVSLVQLLATPFLAPLNVLVGETNGIPLMTYLHDGYECMFHGVKPEHAYNEKTIDCNYSLYTYFFYIIFNLGFNVSLVALTKYGSSVQSWMVVRLLLPTTLVLLLWRGWPFLQSQDRGINSYVIVGAILAFLGATIFRYSTIYIENIKNRYHINGEITCLWPLRI